MNCKGLKYYYLSYKKTAWANFHITPMNTCQIKIYKLSLEFIHLSKIQFMDFVNTDMA